MIRSGFPDFRSKVRRSLLTFGVVCLSLSLVGSCHTARFDIPGAAFAATGAMGVVGGAARIDGARRPDALRALQWKIVEKPESLLRLAGLDIAMMLEAPDLQRKDLPSIVWQYRTPACILDLYFRAGEAGDIETARLVHYDIRSRKGQVVGAKDCMTSLIRDRAPVPFPDGRIALAGG